LASAARAALAFLPQAVIASVKLSSMKKIDLCHISEPAIPGLENQASGVSSADAKMRNPG
jgi:hypothetical protein